MGSSGGQQVVLQELHEGGHPSMTWTRRQGQNVCLVARIRFRHREIHTTVCVPCQQQPDPPCSNPTNPTATMELAIQTLGSPIHMDFAGDPDSHRFTLKRD